MSVRWPRYLPRFPSFLLLPTIVVPWAVLGAEPSLWGWEWRFPLTFCVWNVPNLGWSIIGVVGFVVDTSLVMAVAWAFAMAVERLAVPYFRWRFGTRDSARAQRRPGEPN